MKLKEVIKESSALISTFDENILDSYSKYLENMWQRKYYLGLVMLNKDYKKIILESVYQELDAFAVKIKMDSVQKNAINNAIIQLDTKLSENILQLEFPTFLIDVLQSDFYKYAIGDLIEPIILKEAKESKISIDDLVDEYMKILKLKIPKEDERLLTFSDFNKTFEKIPKIVEEAFNPETRGIGFGIIGMQERVKNFGGDFAIKSEHEKGTKLSLHIPVNL